MAQQLHSGVWSGQEPSSTRGLEALGSGADGRKGGSEIRRDALEVLFG